MNRRFFLGGLIAAPAGVAADNIMPVRSIERLMLPVLWGDGVHDDYPAVQAMINGARYLFGGRIMQQSGSVINVPNGTFWLGGTILMNRPSLVRGAPGYGSQIISGNHTGIYVAKGTLDRFKFRTTI